MEVVGFGCVVGGYCGWVEVENCFLIVEICEMDGVVVLVEESEVGGGGFGF